MRKTSLFATDLDGTLLKNNSTFSSDDIEALVRLQQSGCSIVLATGRSPYSFNKCVKDVKLPVDWYIFSSGAVIMNSELEAVSSSSLSKEQTTLIYNTFINLGVNSVSIQGEYPNAHFFNWKKGIHCADFRRRLHFYREFATEFETSAICSTEVIAYVKPEIADNVIEKFKKVTSNAFSVIKATSPLDHKTIWIEIFPRDVNKATACEKIRSICNIEKESTAAIGNDWNDLPMLEWAKTSFVTSNAPAQLVNLFPVTPNNNNKAVHHAISVWKNK